MEINYLNSSYIQTQALVNTITANADKWVEARLCFNGFAATHFLYFTANKLYDEGIDGEELETSILDFSNRYQDCYWRIDNIVYDMNFNKTV
jgi:hypothetical protein